MTVAIIIGVCVVLLILAFLLPRLSRYPQRGVDSTLTGGQRAATLPQAWGRGHRSVRYSLGAGVPSPSIGRGCRA